MSPNIKEAYDFDFSNLSYREIKLIKYTGQSILFKADKYAILARPASAFGNENFKFELDRRIDATKLAKQKLPGLVQNSEFIIINAKIKSGNSSSDIKLMARVVPWIKNVKWVKDYEFKKIITDRLLIESIRGICGFVIVNYFLTGKLFDLFNLFEEVKLNSDRNIMKLLSPNIMEGIDPKTTKRIIFIDPDWYLKTPDRKLTGFPLKSYLRRIIEGISLLTITYIIFTFFPFMYRIASYFKLIIFNKYAHSSSH